MSLLTRISTEFSTRTEFSLWSGLIEKGGIAKGILYMLKTRIVTEVVVLRAIGQVWKITQLSGCLMPLQLSGYLST